MPSWNPLQISLLIGLVCGSLWSVRTVAKHLGIAGVWMVVEVGFWRSLFMGFAVTFALFGLLSLILTGVIWLLLNLVDVIA